MSDPLLLKLKILIVETLRLEDVTPADIPDDEPLIGGGLSLDSIDALELVVRLEKEFGVKIASSEESKAALANVSGLANYLRKHADPSRLPAA
jgi:acyl carrier protein